MDEPREQFQSQVFEEIAPALTPEIAILIERGELAPPFEVLLSDADHRLVCCAEMNERGTFRNLLDSKPPLRASFPVKANVTDRSGNIWHASLGVSELPSLA